MSKVIQERTARATGTVVQVVDNRDGGFDAADLGWFTVCVDHGGVCSHPTRKLAVDWPPVPDQWCPDCQHAAMPENWAELPEGYELTFIIRQDGSHPQPTCGHAENVPGVGWSADCLQYARYGYRSLVRHSMTTHAYDDYACAGHLAEMAKVIAAQISEQEA